MDTFLLLSCLLICFLITPTFSLQSIPFEELRLSAHPEFKTVRDHGIRASSTSTSSSVTKFRTYYYKQTLDHFNYRPDSFITFNQRYVIDFQYWGGAKTDAPIFVNLGEEVPLELDMKAIGFLHEHAPKLKALIVFIEHRYYGQSVPFASRQEAFRNASQLGYFTSTQALADYAEVILHVKKMLMAERSPVVVFGASYGGMLASWFRLKYPHVAMGALASSAPILYFDDLVPADGGYYAVVSSDFKAVSQSCHDTIAQSWLEIAKIAEKPNGLQLLSRLFNTCSPFKSATILETYLVLMYRSSAQYNRAPVYQVSRICEAIDGAPKGTSVLKKVYAVVVAYNRGSNVSCHNIGGYRPPIETAVGWAWQRCSDMVMPIGRGRNATMFPYSPFDLQDFMNTCYSQYGVYPRPHWIVTEFGGHDIDLVLKKFGSNIIFSNGLKDPWSSGGVLHNISDSIVAVTTTEGSHCLDVLYSSPDDPIWVIKQRATEIEIIKGWIREYNLMHEIN
ncbi:hypothetical protein Sjap_013635 [Stephania japonica]|uniref:Lysosomal Pro-X carboxypeptidase n=1 Tax=Stephania japonica TaxID=461633 RepID=A0AAP0IYF9_9MAGN